MRAAIYFTPAEADPLTAAAAKWLMRDAFSGETLAPPADISLSADGLRELTAEPRRYGFHATMKAPFRLADSIDIADVETALSDFCQEAETVTILDPVVGQIGRFFAIIPAAPNPAVNALAAKAVEAFDRFRASLSEAQLAKRRAAGLTPSQDANLVRWGYPYVFEEFRFHMTLTGPVVPERQEEVGTMLKRRFGPLVQKPLPVDSLALFVEPEPDGDFTVQARFAFGTP